MAHKKVTDIKEVDKSKQLDSALGQIERMTLFLLTFFLHSVRAKLLRTCC